MYGISADESLCLSEARSKLTWVYNQAAHDGRVLEISKRGDDKTVLFICRQNVEHFWRSPNTEQFDIKSALSLAVAQRFLCGAPEHILAPQVAELQGLTVAKLVQLYEVPLPLDGESRKRLQRQINQSFLARLEKRAEVARLIKEGEDEGLFDRLEEQTSRRPL